MKTKPGFTMIEAMLAMLISSVILTGLGIIYVTGIYTWQQTESKLELQRQGSLAIAEIKKWTQPADMVETNYRILRVRFPETDSTAAVWHQFALRDKKLYRDDSLLTEIFEDRPGLRNLQVSDFKADWDPWLKTVEVKLHMTLDTRIGLAKVPETIQFDSRIKLRNYTL